MAEVCPILSVRVQWMPPWTGKKRPRPKPLLKAMPIKKWKNKVHLTPIKRKINLNIKKINLSDKLSLFDTYWDPKIVGDVNNHQVKLVKFKGEFDWHRHGNEDEMFLVVSGSFDMQFPDKTITLSANEMIIVPRGVDHCPSAEEEVHVLIIEPVTVLNTGNIKTDKTVNSPEKI